MLGIHPTYGIFETSRNVRMFNKEHNTILWSIIRPILPWIAACYIFDIVVNALVPKFEDSFFIGALFAQYFYACLCISWHRVLLQGEKRAMPMNPFRPQKSDLAFVFIAACLLMALMIPLYFVEPVLEAEWEAGVAFTIGYLALIFIIFKMIFYFPAKAVGAHISLKESLSLTDGYLLRLVVTSLIASLGLTLIMTAYLLMVVIFMVAFKWSDTVFSILVLPTDLYFMPLITVIGVGVLSNYYQHALQVGHPKKQK